MWKRLPTVATNHVIAIELAGRPIKSNTLVSFWTQDARSNFTADSSLHELLVAAGTRSTGSREIRKRAAKQYSP